MKKIVITNQKGGVAKTTSVLNIACGLSKNRKKVLLVDLDPQASLSLLAGIGESNGPSIADAFKTVVNEEAYNAKDFISKTSSFDIIKGSKQLKDIEMQMVSIISREFILESLLENLESEYDYIIIDTPPSIGLLLLNALVAAQEVLIPLRPEYLPAEGVGELLKTIKVVKRRYNSDLMIKGAFFTMVRPRLKLTKEVERLLVESFSGMLPILSTIIPNTVKFGEANLQRKSIFEYARDHKGAIAYNALIKEVFLNDEA